MKIPVIVADEHNEAFVAWHRFKEQKIIGETGNYLLHVDHHDDMVCGGYNWDFTQLAGTTEEARRLMDQALGIADFIVPAIYQGLFSTVHILKNLRPVSLKKKEQYVCLASAKELICGDYVPFFHAAEKMNSESDYRFFSRIDGGLLGEDDLPQDGIVLDVDFDYFCWDNSLGSVPEARIEITAAAYEEFVNDRNHPFRILPKKVVNAKEQEGKYWLVYKEHLSTPQIASEETIVRRMDKLIDYLAQAKMAFRAMDVCRSSHSGYLPSSRAAFVEREFFARIQRIMELEFWE
ncbi:UPF0489 family protein [Selenomonas sp. KH1T6]|uniref:UPF0489 family protein n=1 Tax=Selenomonas sp. KH1T6 TaxID=3158784 RepID=UPI0008A7ED1C|nr:UPF0489 domain-containing protein [Selenomonas ruminantium]